MDHQGNIPKLGRASSLGRAGTVSRFEVLTMTNPCQRAKTSAEGSNVRKSSISGMATSGVPARLPFAMPMKSPLAMLFKVTDNLASEYLLRMSKIPPTGNAEVDAIIAALAVVRKGQDVVGSLDSVAIKDLLSSDGSVNSNSRALILVAEQNREDVVGNVDGVAVEDV